MCIFHTLTPFFPSVRTLTILPVDRRRLMMMLVGWLMMMMDERLLFLLFDSSGKVTVTCRSLGVRTGRTVWRVSVYDGMDHRTPRLPSDDPLLPSAAWCSYFSQHGLAEPHETLHLGRELNVLRLQGDALQE